MSLDQAQVLAEWAKNDRENVRVAISEFKGRKRLDIRVWYQAGDEYRPGKQGISLPLEQLTELCDALRKAQAAGRPK